MKRLVAIRDNVAEFTHVPFAVNSLTEAFRAMKDEMSNKDSRLAQHPGDFDLLHVADFDDNIGAIVQVSGAPVYLANGSDIFKELYQNASNSSEGGL